MVSLVDPEPIAVPSPDEVSTVAAEQSSAPTSPRAPVADLGAQETAFLAIQAVADATGPEENSKNGPGRALELANDALAGGATETEIGSLFLTAQAFLDDVLNDARAVASQILVAAQARADSIITEAEQKAQDMEGSFDLADSRQREIFERLLTMMDRINQNNLELVDAIERLKANSTTELHRNGSKTTSRAETIRSGSSDGVVLREAR